MTNKFNQDDFRQELLHRLHRAYLEARKGKRKTNDEHRFEINDTENLMNLCDSIISRTYRPSRGIAFLISRPVRREIFAAPFRDRVVHHLLYDISNEWWDRRLIDASFSCRNNKGTLCGIKTLEKHLRRATHNYTREAFIAKLDLQGYFMSLDRSRLFSLIKKGLGEQFHHNLKNPLYRTVLFLWKQIIFDDPTKGVIIRGNPEGWKKLPRSKSLFAQPRGRGIVIGNLTSQLISNIFLNQLDRYITMKLGYKYYGRYVDDFYIIVPMDKKDQLLRDLKLIEKFLKNLGLTLHPKKRYFQSSKKGVEFLGSVVYEGYIVPGRRIRRNTREAFRKVAEGHRDLESVVSYLGHLKHINSDKFLKTAFDEFGWDYQPEGHK